jgi:hypothetical protein
MFIRDFIDEYRRYRALGEKAMAQVSDDALNHVPVADGNSIAVIGRHVGGNLVSRFTDFLTSDGEKPWRNRDGEFADGPIARADLDRAWRTGFDLVERELGALSDDVLTRTITLRSVPQTVHAALCRSLAHTAMHTGQIVLLAKIAAGSNWKTLSIPKGQSAQHNEHVALGRGGALGHPTGA